VRDQERITEVVGGTSKGWQKQKEGKPGTLVAETGFERIVVEGGGRGGTTGFSGFHHLEIGKDIHAVK